MVQPLRPDAFLHGGHGAELDQLAVPSRHVEPRHVVRRGALCGIELHHHVVQLVVLGERAHAAATEQRLHRARDVAHAHAEVLRAIPVEADGELRLVDPEVGVHVAQARNLAGALHERVHGQRELGEIGVTDDELHRLARTPERRRVVGEYHDAGDRRELALHFGDDVLHRPPGAVIDQPREDQAATG